MSGYLEKAFREFVLEYARRNGSESLTRFVEHNARYFTNLKTGKICEYLGYFREAWADQFRDEIFEEEENAVNSVVNLRNRIAHGESVSLTMGRIRGYYACVNRVVTVIGNICVPNP